MDEFIDKTDGKSVFHSPIVFHQKAILAINTLERVASREQYNFMAYPFAEAIQDSRVPLVKISHALNYHESNQPKESHIIEFVMDPKDNNPNKPPHLNLSGPSKKFLSDGGCKRCKSYFLGMDHFPITFIGGKEYGNYKFSDMDLTLDNFFKKLEKGGFYKEFPYYRQLPDDLTLML
jgi:hypothetical protein